MADRADVDPAPQHPAAPAFPALGVVVVALLFFAVLAAITVPVIEDKLGESRVDTARRELSELSLRMQSRFDAAQRWDTIDPRDGDLTDAEFDLTQLDPWGHPLRVYHSTEGRGAILLVSRGPDGRLDSTLGDLLGLTPQGDDLMQTVTRQAAPAQ